MMKKIFAGTGLVLLFATGAIFAACDDGSRNSGGGEPTVYEITSVADDVYGDFYDLKLSMESGESWDRISTTETGKTVTVTPEIGKEWGFLRITEVCFNGTPCTAGANGTYTFVMPAADVSVTATGFEIVEVPEAEYGMTWVSTPELVTSSLDFTTSFEITFGSRTVNASAGTEGLLYVEIISTNQSVIPDEAVFSERTDLVNAGTSGAKIVFDRSLISAGETTLIVVDKDNDRAISLTVTVVQGEY